MTQKSVITFATSVALAFIAFGTAPLAHALDSYSSEWVNQNLSPTHGAYSNAKGAKGRSGEIMPSKEVQTPEGGTDDVAKAWLNRHFTPDHGIYTNTK